MKKISFASVSIALVIAFFYTFVLCMVGDTDNTLQTADYYIPTSETECLGPTDSSATVDETDTDITSPEIYEKYIETSWWKANLAAYTSTQIASGITTTTTLTTAAPKQTTVTTAATTPATTALTTTTLPPQTTTVAATTPSITAATTVANIATDEKLSYSVNGVSYRGNAYDVLCQIVSAEMPTDFSDEAIKAQAIATYSYIKYNNLKGLSPSVSIRASVPTKIANAVKSVYGLTAYYNGQVAQTVYCSSTGGATNDAKNVWGGQVPYLTSVISEYDNLDRYYGVNKTFSEAEVRSTIESITGIKLSNDPQNWITILPAEQGGILDGGYVGKVLIDGNSYYLKNGNKVNITGRVIRENIFSFKLNSPKFTVTYNNGNFTFTTYGYGHGVGMSQHGANLYATKAGYTYTQILQHYYSGITIS